MTAPMLVTMTERDLDLAGAPAASSAYSPWDLPMASGAPTVLQGFNAPVISRAVLELGQPQSGAWPGTTLAPTVNQDTWIAEWFDRDREDHMVTLDNEGVWAFGTKMPTIETSINFRQTQMTRRGAAGKIDDDLISIARRGSGFDLALELGLLAREVVELTVEEVVANLLTTPANYAGNSTDLAGSEWDAAGGDSLTDVDTVVDTLIAGNPGIGREHIHAVLTGQAKEAAYRDVAWAAARGGIEVNRPSTVEAIRNYWGIGRVSWFDVHSKAAGAARFSATSLYGDVAIFFVDTTLPGVPLRAQHGSFVFARRFSYTGGTARRSPFFREEFNSFFFPWVSYDHPQIINPGSGFLLENVKAP